MKKVILLLMCLFLMFKVHSQTDSTIMVFDKNYKLSGVNVDMSDYSRFTPTVEDYLNIENLVAKHVFTYSNKYTYDNKPINFSNYNKQIFGLINAIGDKILFINCFYKSDNHNYWRKEIVSVRGGGRYYFNIKINLSNNAIFDFRLNAPR